MRLEDLEQEFPEMPEEMRAMIEREVDKQTKQKTVVTYKRRKKMARKALVASMAAVLLLGTTVFAGVIFQMRSEKVGKYAVRTKVEGNGENLPSTEQVTETEQKIPNVKLEVSYLPEGMVETETGKYSYQDNLYHGGVSVVFYRMDTGDNQFDMLTTNVISAEDIKVGDYDGTYLEMADAVSGDSEVTKRIYVAYTDVHYVMELYAAPDVSKEEALKVAEGIRLIPTEENDGENIVNDYNWSEYLASLQEAEDVTFDENISVAASEMKNTHKIGETFAVSGEKVTGIETGTGSLTVCVSKVQVLDNISLLNPSVMDEDAAKALAEETDEAGSLLPAKINYVKYGDGVNTVDEIVATREVPQKLVYASVEYTNTSDVTLSEVIFFGSLCKIVENGNRMEMYRGKLPDATKDWDGASILGQAHMQEMWYYDVHGGERGNNYIPSIAPGETVTVHMAWLVPEEELGCLYLNLDTYSGSYEFSDSALQMGYVDIRQ